MSTEDLTSPRVPVDHDDLQTNRRQLPGRDHVTPVDLIERVPGLPATPLRWLDLHRRLPPAAHGLDPDADTEILRWERSFGRTHRLDLDVETAAVGRR